MDALRSLLTEHGLSLVFVNVLVAQLGLPLPALPMLIVAGALIAEGNLQILPLAGVVTIASLLGDSTWYLAGRRYGYTVLRRLCRVSIEPDSCVRHTENVFSRWGAPSLLVAKYIPGFSTVAPPLAGTLGVTVPRFVAFSAVAALLWAAAPVAAGFFFRNEVDRALSWLESLGTGALLLLGGAVAAYVLAKGVQRYLLIRFLRMVRIGADELRALMDRGANIVILDVRSALARGAEPRRLPGAIAVELAAIDSVLPRIPPDAEVVVYCS